MNTTHMQVGTNTHTRALQLNLYNTTVRLLTLTRIPPTLDAPNVVTTSISTTMATLFTRTLSLQKTGD